MSTVGDLQREDPGCAEVEAMLPLVADGALGPDDEPSVFAHLSRCDACQRSLARHDLIELAVAGGRCRETPSAFLRWRRLSWPLASGLAAALVAIIVGTLLTPPPVQGSPTVLKPGREVFRLERRGGPPLYVIREGDRELVIDPSEQPAADPRADAPSGDAQQVLYRWY